MASLNKVFLIGNLVRDPELRKLPSGDDVATFRMAVNRRFRDRNGTDREETVFLDVTVYGNRAGPLCRYMRRGMPIFVEGRLRQEEWTGRDGQRQSRISIVAENFEFLGVGGRGSTGASAPGAGPEGTAPAEPPVAETDVSPSASGPPAEPPSDTGEQDPDDLPF
jgi:single-strand DNA-binding protein